MHTIGPDRCMLDRIFRARTTRNFEKFFSVDLLIVVLF